jgi:hypothetical protein
MSAFDPSIYEQRRRSLTQNFGAEGAMNAYQQFVSQQRGQRGLADLTRQYEKAAPRVVSAYGRRGLSGPNVRSGITARALQEFAQQRIREQSEMERGLQESAYGYDLGERRRQEMYQSALQDLEAEKAREIAESARSILSYRAGV